MADAHFRDNGGAKAAARSGPSGDETMTDDEQQPWELSPRSAKRDNGLNEEFNVSVCIPEPALPAHLKDNVQGDPDWGAKVLEALAEQLTAANDFYHPLRSAAQELRDLRLVRGSLIELLRTVNPNSKPYSRLDQY